VQTLGVRRDLAGSWFLCDFGFLRCARPAQDSKGNDGGAWHFQVAAFFKIESVSRGHLPWQHGNTTRRDEIDACSQSVFCSELRPLT
jgi:hypothetical protein